MSSFAYVSFLMAKCLGAWEQHVWCSAQSRKGWQQGQLLSAKSCSETTLMYCHKWSFITAMSEYYQKNKCYCLFPWRSFPFPGEPRNPWHCAAMPAAIRLPEEYPCGHAAVAKHTGTALTELLETSFPHPHLWSGALIELGFRLCWNVWACAEGGVQWGGDSEVWRVLISWLMRDGCMSIISP